MSLSLIVVVITLTPRLWLFDIIAPSADCRLVALY
jgi:hypothetical protein